MRWVSYVIRTFRTFHVYTLFHSPSAMLTRRGKNIHSKCHALTIRNTPAKLSPISAIAYPHSPPRSRHPNKKSSTIRPIPSWRPRSALSQFRRTNRQNFWRNIREWFRRHGGLDWAAQIVDICTTATQYPLTYQRMAIGDKCPAWHTGHHSCRK